MLNLHIDPPHSSLPQSCSRINRMLALLGLAAALAACGGGDEAAITTGTPVAVTVNGQTVSSTITPTLTYAVSGSLSGMAVGQSLVLQDASGLTASFSANGTYTLLTSLPSGTPYNLSVKTPPPGQSCSISNGVGSIASASIANVQVACTSPFLRLLAGNVDGSGRSDGIGSAARFNGPNHVAFDSLGNAFVTDRDNSTIRKITPAGLVSTFAGSPTIRGSADGAGAAATFSVPVGIVVDRADNVYVADSDNRRIRKITPAGLVSTFVVSSGRGFRDGDATTAQFTAPQGLAIDSSDNIYVADSLTESGATLHAIRKITPAGLVSTLAGSASAGTADGTGTAAQFNTPVSVAVDGSGTVYVADSNNHSIRKITAAGAVTTLAGSTNSTFGYVDGASAVARFVLPTGVAVDSTGNVYVTDRNNHSIRKIATDGQVSTLAGRFSPSSESGSADGQGSAARFSFPQGISLDRAGNLYVGDSNNQTIRKITPDGLVSTVAGAASVFGFADGLGAAALFNGPRGIAADSSGNAYVIDSSNNTIRKITPAGQVSTVAGSTTRGSLDGEGTAARFSGPSGVAIDSAGNLYVADSSNRRIRKITPAGLVSTLAGSTNGYADGTGAAAQFGRLAHLAVDSAGNVYVADSDNRRIRKVTPAGLVSTLAGSATRGDVDGTGTLAHFNFPVGIAVDDAGNVYVADFSSATIRKISPAGVVSTLAGSPRLSGTDDGTGSAARFRQPNGLAIDSAGNLYVADTGNHTIRKVTPTGEVSTVLGVAGRDETTVGGLPKLLASPSYLSITGNTLYITTRNGVVVTTLP